MKTAQTLSMGLNAVCMAEVSSWPACRSMSQEHGRERTAEERHASPIWYIGHPTLSIRSGVEGVLEAAVRRYQYRQPQSRALPVSITLTRGH